MDTKTIEHFLQVELVKDNLISELIDEIYGQKAQLNILHEEMADQHFTRTLTLDIFENFAFDPVAYCIVSISNASHLDNLDEYHIVEKSCKNCQVVFSKLIEDSLYPDVKKYLKDPYYGRVVKLICDGREIGELVEFISIQPNVRCAKSVLEYLSKYRTVISSKRRLEELLNHFLAAFNCEKQEIMDVVFSEFHADLVKIIDREVLEIDHFAFLIDPTLPIEEVEEVLNKNGFKDNHRKFPSAIVSKELGKKINKHEVPTDIVKATATNGSREIEIFIPSASKAHVENWINSGLGSHIAFRLKSESSIYRILKALNENQIPIPSFMMGKPLKNSVEGSTVLYCEVKASEYNFRVEFLFKEDR